MELDTSYIVLTMAQAHDLSFFRIDRRNFQTIREAVSYTHLDVYKRQADIDMLGVNNRNLGTFHTDVNNSFKLVDKMRGFSPLLVSESGISETDTVRRLREAGFRGFLIGETFMKTERPGDTLADFIGGLA